MTTKIKGLADYGPLCYQHGYQDLIPLLPGKKVPGFAGWTGFEMTPEKMESMLANGKADADVGLLNARFPTLDADIYDATVSKAYFDKVQAYLGGDGLVRIGQAPKFAIICRTNDPFPHVVSPQFRAPDGVRHQVEFRGTGQQVKLFGIHPDTGRPYRWRHDRHPANTAASTLPVVTETQARDVVALFAECIPGDWERLAGAGGNGAALPAGVDADERFLLTHKNPIGLTPSEITEQLDRLAALNDGYVTDRDLWVSVGASVHHETGGSAEGLDIWDTWSQGAENYAGPEDCAAVWRSFKPNGAGGTRTFLSVQRYIEDEEREAASQQAERYAEAIEAAETIGVLQDKIAAEIRADRTLGTLQRGQLAKAMQARLAVVADFRPTIAEVRKLLAPQRQVDISFCSPWVLVGQDGTHYLNKLTGNKLTRWGFDNFYESAVSDSGEKDDEGAAVRPSHYANVVARVPSVDAVMYAPGHDEFFEMDKRRYLNTYTVDSAPDVPEHLSANGRTAIATVEEHFRQLFADDHERATVLDYFTHCVQNPEIKPNWALLIQGAQGAGKSALTELMRQVLGSVNVAEMPGSGVESSFNDWAEGQQLLFVEEVRFVGDNRFTVLNNLKPMITNPKISVHRKGKDRYQVINTTAYVLYSNFSDALPLDDADRRYFIASTAVQTKNDLLDFDAQNPGYFPALFDAIRGHAGALRRWFLGREIGSEFDSQGRAPESQSKARMIGVTQSDHKAALEVLLDREQAGSNRLLLSSRMAIERLRVQAGLDGESITWSARRLSVLLMESGFAKCGRVQIDNDDHFLWSVRPGIIEKHVGKARDLLSAGKSELSKLR